MSSKTCTTYFHQKTQQIFWWTTLEMGIVYILLIPILDTIWRKKLKKVKLFYYCWTLATVLKFFSQEQRYFSLCFMLLTLKEEFIHEWKRSHHLLSQVEWVFFFRWTQKKIFWRLWEAKHQWFTHFIFFLQSKLVGTSNCLVAHIHQNIFFCAQHKTEINTCLIQHDWVNNERILSSVPLRAALIGFPLNR